MAKCSVATLNGTYLFGTDGVEIKGQGQAQVRWAAAGYEVYSGNGTVKSVLSFSVNGKITHHQHASGTYTVNEDCTGAVTYEDGRHYDQFIAPDGSMFAWVQTDPGAVAAGVERRGTAERVGQ